MYGQKQFSLPQHISVIGAVMCVTLKLAYLFASNLEIFKIW